jgi:phosphoribosyl 1,2-cyclic phosphate phosphodiesterase
MELIFLGTGGAWGLPELNCSCQICNEHRRKGEKRDRTALLLSGGNTLLIDCGPDIRAQLSRNQINKVDTVLITHEHGDHYMGLDELFAYKRTMARDAFSPIPVCMSLESWRIIQQRFGYLEEMGVMEVSIVQPGEWLDAGVFTIMPFKTDHGTFASGSVGFVIGFPDRNGKAARVVYTSDFMNLPEILPALRHADYLIIQSFWLNEPVENRPHHMSFQRAIPFIRMLEPKKETFLVHIGDADQISGDPANIMLKKYAPKAPLSHGEHLPPYPIPLNQEQWQQTVDQIRKDCGLSARVTVAYDDQRIEI